MRLCTAAWVSDGCLRARGDDGGATRRVSLKLWRFCEGADDDGTAAAAAAAPESELSRRDEELADGGERESVLDRGDEAAESLAGSVGGWLLSVMTVCDDMISFECQLLLDQDDEFNSTAGPCTR